MKTGLCYFCEKRDGLNVLFKKPACDQCYNSDIRTLNTPEEERNLTDDKRAFRKKMLIQTFNDVFGEVKQ